MNIIRIPGLADYQETLELQEQLVRAHQEDPEREDDLLLLEHAGFIPSGARATTPACTPVPRSPSPFMKSTVAGRPPTTAPASS